MYFFILLGGDGYFGRNFTKYILPHKVLIIDKHPKFSSMMPFNYIEHDLKNEIDINKLKIDVSKYEIVVINFAAISFVDDSIANPNETIDNNLKCCINGFLFSQQLGIDTKYIYISTDEVRANKTDETLSAYIKSKVLSERYLLEKAKTHPNIKILRPVNLMDVIDEGKPELRQQNQCLLTKIANCPTNGHIYIHGTGEQRRMFMRMKTACKILYDISISKINRMFNPDRLLLFDVVEYPGLRTENMKIKDIVYYLADKFYLNYSHIEDPRGKYQDETYLSNSEHVKRVDYENSLELIFKCVVRMKM
jgi:nucleoside-diphosphate-sugar epimerase